MTINEQISNLLENNCDLFEGEPIAYDGIVDEKTFVSSKYRPMFLLKEVNDNGIIPDWTKYMDFICNEAKTDRNKAHWQNVNYWIEALYHPNKNFEDCTKGTFRYINDLNQNMLHISIVNIKKTLGKSKSDMQEIMKATVKNKELLLAEINIIAPRLIICGGTYECAKLIYPGYKEEYLPCGLPYFIVKEDNGNSVFVIDFLHPSISKIRSSMLYTYAKVAFAELTAKMQEYSNELFQ
ncbi:MAG: hypothetical protein ACI4XJ_09390 [Eubacteriales bacterium]